MTNRTEEIEEAVIKSVEENGYELVEWKLAGKRGDLVKIYIYHEAGIDFHDCKKVSREVGKKIDARNLIHGSYTVEVSSPGLDRKLKKDIDFRINLGRFLRVDYKNEKGKTRTEKGELYDYDKEKIFLKTKKDKEIQIPRESIKLAKVEIVF